MTLRGKLLHFATVNLLLNWWSTAPAVIRQVSVRVLFRPQFFLPFFRYSLSSITNQRRSLIKKNGLRLQWMKFIQFDRVERKLQLSIHNHDRCPSVFRPPKIWISWSGSSVQICERSKVACWFTKKRVWGVVHAVINVNRNVPLVVRFSRRDLQRQSTKHCTHLCGTPALVLPIMRGERHKHSRSVLTYCNYHAFHAFAMLYCYSHTNKAHYCCCWLKRQLLI